MLSTERTCAQEHAGGSQVPAPTSNSKGIRVCVRVESLIISLELEFKF